MRRREFITLLGGAAATWPLAARAQQPAMPVIGFLRITRAEESGHLVAAVRQGLRESGYPRDKVSIESRWADGRKERLPKLAAELVALQVAAIVGNVDAVLAAKMATARIPIIFVTGADPVAAGLVSSISRPGSNITGVSFYDVPITGKRLALLREMVPKAEIIAVLQDPNFSVGLAAFHAIPASYPLSGFVDAGGLVSYGASQTDAYRRAGIYVARILNGEKPGDLPVELPTKYELVINLKTAKALGLTVPPALIARADEVIQ